MILIPPEARLKSTIKSGSVYYFRDEALSSPYRHYFIVLNHSPHVDEVILLVCSSSQIEKVNRRRENLPGTAIEIRKEEYPDFDVDSIVDCNTVFPRSIEVLIKKLETGELKIKADMDLGILKRLRAAVLASPLVSDEVKKLLSSPSHEM